MQTYTVIFQLTSEVKPEFSDAYKVAACFPRGIVRNYKVFHGLGDLEPLAGPPMLPTYRAKPVAKFSTRWEAVQYIDSWLAVDAVVPAAAFRDYQFKNDLSVAAADEFITGLGY